MSNNNNVKNKNVIIKNKKSEKKRITALLLFFVVFVVILIGTVFGNCVQIYENKKATAEYKEYYEGLLEEEASLNSEVVKLQDPDYVARYARERYGYTKSGEKILTIIDGKIVVDDKN